MRILYVCQAGNSSCNKIRRIVEIIAGAESYDLFSSTHDLEQHIRSSFSTDSLLILHANSKKQLKEYVNLQEILIDHKIILILPDRTPSTLSLGHRLRPRFITYRDSDFLELTPVLHRIMSDAERSDEGGYHGS